MPGDIDRNRQAMLHISTMQDTFFNTTLLLRHRRRIVKHLLRFENLYEEFHDLMKQYDLPVRLPWHH
jgi:hypothetical protein